MTPIVYNHDLELVMAMPELTTWGTEPLLEGYDPETKEGEFKIAPAKWIWLPSERTLPCTFVMFRKQFELEKVPKFARGWIAADSRYVLYVNGERIQFGPAPHDPRHAEADPVDIARYLKKGTNVIGVHVLFYGQGDGTWPTGKPGLIFRVNVGREVIASDNTWKCSVDRSRTPGRAKRWYLRALQEDYDASKFWHGWNFANYATDLYWYDAEELKTPGNAAAIASPYPSYGEDIALAQTKGSTLIGRSIPMMVEEELHAPLFEYFRVNWKGNPNDWFDFRVPGLMETLRCEPPERLGPGCHLLTYELPFLMIGWPEVFCSKAPEGAIIELICQESRSEDQTLLDTQFFAWTRFRLSPDQSRYEPFDYEACKYIQLHVEVPPGKSMSRPSVSFRRRVLLTNHAQRLEVDNPRLQMLMVASDLTLKNSAQDIVVDGMARERQQYAGDCAHQLHAVRQAHGNISISRRFLRQFGYGQMENGVWFDSWPAYDRYARLAQRQLGLTNWGPLVDHSIGFVIEHVNHWLQTGERQPYEENRDRIMRFMDYLQTITGLDGLLRVEDLGTEAVWLDHDSYQEQAHKKLAFNLYAFQMRVMLGWIEGEPPNLDLEIDAIRRQFWHDKVGAFINNRYEIASRGARYCDRSISHLLWLHAHGVEIAPDLTKAIDLLVRQPKSLGIGYPANSVWRHWALARIGRVDLIIDELMTRWATMASVRQTTTIQEMWNAIPGGKDQMSHCAVAPTIAMHQAVLGIGQNPDGSWFIRPQMGSLRSIDIHSWTPFGKLCFKADLGPDDYVCQLVKPQGMPLTIRTSTPLELPFRDRGHEFSTDLTEMSLVEFRLSPYAENRLIYEIEKVD
ncbi:MAG: alpha-L-rhamnosidase N-terminal domain-containing protein [Armatimonadetes bacterium]|nr:alpha-L-rhamnosidase N-terminal domain-containing protein [Armatimonadota bacterium]